VPGADLDHPPRPQMLKHRLEHERVDQREALRGGGVLKRAAHPLEWKHNRLLRGERLA
jgi:hypothetical protein